MARPWLQAEAGLRSTSYEVRRLCDLGAAEVTEVVDVAGGRLWTATRGTGPAMVLCHGGPGLSDNLGAVAAMVEDLGCVHRFDQRGGGRSSAKVMPDVDGLIADLESLRTHWGHQQWVVGGHSWGANLALLYALAHPDRVAGVIYMSGTGLRWGWQDSATRIRTARLTAVEREHFVGLGRAVADGDTRHQAEFLRLLWTTDFARRDSASVLERSPLYAYPRNEAVFAAVSDSYRDALESLSLDALRSLAAPLLALHGAEDTDPWRAREVAELSPRGQWVAIEDAAHVPWIEQPTTTSHHLRRFLRELR